MQQRINYFTTALFVFITGLLFYGCSDDDQSSPNVQVLSSSLNGYDLGSDMEDISTELTVQIVFGSGVSEDALKTVISFQKGSEDVAYDLSLANSNSKLVLTASLEYATSYSFSISAGATISDDGGQLATAIEADFTTIASDTIHSMAPCTGSSDCFQSIDLSLNGETATFWTYANYPFQTENAVWDDLTQAIIVVHGQNRDADNYYTYLTSVLETMNLSSSTVLIAPWFKEDADDTDLYWSTSGWREGGNSSGTRQISSYSVVDSLITYLTDNEHFPAMEKVIVTGHSSGGMFTHTYSAATSIDSEYPEVTFEFVVANSQYFYYPLDYRYDESAETFYEPTGCIGYADWPFGFSSTPAYIAISDQETFNDRFASRSVTYFLGNKTSDDSSLNTDDCQATLLGSSRYQRGENMYLFMNTYFPDHQHSKAIVDGIGHDGSGMYLSDEFEALLTSLLN